MAEITQEQKESIDYLRAEAKKCGMTMDEFLNGSILKILEAIWKIQNEKDGSVSMDELMKELRGEVNG